MSKRMTRYETVEHVVGAACEVRASEAIDTRVFATRFRMSIAEKHFWMRLSQPGRFVYTASTTCRWRLNSGAGRDHGGPIPESIVHKWMKQQLLMAQGAVYVARPLWLQGYDPKWDLES